MQKHSESFEVAEYCGNCRFHLRDEEGGVCRRYPPKVAFEGDAMFTVYPIVDETEWCGEHRTKGLVQ